MDLAILARIKKLASLSEFLSRFNKQHTINISDYLDVSMISFLKAMNRKDAISELIEIIDNEICDKKNFHKAILDREKIVSTGIGMGVAIPHAKQNDIDDFFIMIGIKKHSGLNWQALDKTSVRLVFLIGGPVNKQTKYLQILSKLTSAIKDDNLRKNLLKAQSKEEVIALFDQY